MNPHLLQLLQNLNVSPAHKQAYIRIFVKAAQLKNWCTLFCDGEQVINLGYHKTETKNYYQPVISEGTSEAIFTFECMD